MFSRKKLAHAPNAYNARTFWNQIVWVDTLKASTYGYARSENLVHHDIIQVLRQVKKYHFNDTCVCFTKDVDGYLFIQRLLHLPTI